MAKFPLQPRSIPTTGDSTPARSLLRYVWRMSGVHQVYICTLALVVAVVSMVPLELQRRIINGAVGAQDFHLLLVLGAVYLVVLLGQAGLKYVLQIYQGWLSESAIRYNRNHLSRIRREAAHVEESGGRAVSIIGAEIDKLGGFVGEGLAQPCVSLGMMVAIGGYMIVVEPLIALLSLPFLVPQLIVVPWMQRAINKLVEQRVGMLRGLSDTISDSSQERADDDADLSGQLDRIYGNRIRIFLLKFAAKGSVNLLNGLAPLSALIFGGYLVIQGETTIGVVVAFVTGFERLSDPARQLISYYRVAAQANVQHRMIARWM